MTAITEICPICGASTIEPRPVYVTKKENMAHHLHWEHGIPWDIFDLPVNPSIFGYELTREDMTLHASIECPLCDVFEINYIYGPRTPSPIPELEQEFLKHLSDHHGFLGDLEDFHKTMMVFSRMDIDLQQAYNHAIHAITRKYDLASYQLRANISATVEDVRETLLAAFQTVPPYPRRTTTMKTPLYIALLVWAIHSLEDDNSVLQLRFEELKQFKARLPIPSSDFGKFLLALVLTWIDSELEALLASIMSAKEVACD